MNGDASLLEKLLAQGGMGAALLALAYLLGMRLIKAIDKMTDKFEEHTKADVGAITELTKIMVRMDAKLDTVLDERQRIPRAASIGSEDDTPVRGVGRARTPARGVGAYGPGRGNNDDEEG